MNSSVLLDLVLWLALCLDEVNFTHGGMTQENNINMEEDSQPSRRYDADLVDCQNISEIVFLGFFPCLRRNGSGFEASNLNINECDLLAEAAAHLAVERVNQDPDVLPNITLRLYPIYVPSKRASQAVSHINNINIIMISYIVQVCKLAQWRGLLV